MTSPTPIPNPVPLPPLNPPAPDPGTLFISEIDPLPDPAAQVTPNLPGSPGGIIEAVKRAVVAAVRNGLDGSSFTGKVHVDLEYPTQQEQYPAIWVGFSITKLERAGLGQEEVVLTPQNTWSFVQQWFFEGRVSLTVTALSSKDRDRLSDQLVMMLAFARLPEVGIIYQQNQDTKQNRQLMTSLMSNPYVALTPQMGVIIPGGQQATEGSMSWAQNLLLYEDSWSFDLIGQTSMTFSHDGVYTLAAFKPEPVVGLPGQAFPVPISDPTPRRGADLQYTPTPNNYNPWAWH